MSCSNPLRLYETDLKPSSRINHADFTKSALNRSMNSFDFFLVPCRSCLNCRIDRQNEIVDKAEYEYIKYKCGAFVTFTYDDVHNLKNAFIDSKTGKFTYSINKKDGKDFLNRLNKLVHAEADKLKKQGFPIVLCNPDYKYIITHEYGDKFSRNHIHCLFFGLDFAYCERLFWRAWQNQGSIQVGSIKNGGIEYCTKYITQQVFGMEKFFKYAYHHMEAPCSSHSLGFGEGLYLSQLDYIKKNDGYYLWHNKKRPLPSYYKNKYKIISDLDSDKIAKKYKLQCQNIKEMYQVDIQSFRQLTNFKLQKASIRQRNAEIKLVASGKKIFKFDLYAKDLHDFKYSEKRLFNTYDVALSRIINPDGTIVLKVGSKYKDTLTTRDLMLLHTDYKTLCKQYGIKKADKMCGLDTIPF